MTEPGQVIRGRPRNVAGVVGATVLTLGIYAAWYYFVAFREVDNQAGRRHSALFFLAFIPVAGIVFALLYVRLELGSLHADRARLGMSPGVRFAECALWSTVGLLIVIGPLVTLAKVAGMVNGYWLELERRYGVVRPGPANPAAPH